MNDKIMTSGNEAIAEAAVRAGCGAYFGYPITPQNELIAYMARRMLEKGRVFIQAESEIAAINMVYGASCAGARAMTSSSSPGISLKQEGISYAAGADVPMVIVNVARGGPGLGSISPAQSDYFQATRGGGHGDYRSIVLAPKSVQECADLTALAFDLSDKYRMPAIVLADGMIGQMMESGVVFPPEKSPQELPKRDWTAGNMAARAAGPDGRRTARHISSLYIKPDELEAVTRARFARYETVKSAEVRFEENGCEEADLVLAAYGISARVCQEAQKLAAKEGIKLGLFRPVTLWPFPYQALGKIAASGKTVLVVEMSMGQLVEDVKLSFFQEVSLKGLPVPARIHLLSHSGGIIPTEDEVLAEAKRIIK
ncbi:MAG: 3-methyl-2-oxobutanoate dehydrogenase subunit VorB [Treponema sp.]|nr:3-methyl-2-oxobutanoate dehydrogenase subunit VorB [Treponema sp.]